MTDTAGLSSADAAVEVLRLVTSPLMDPAWLEGDRPDFAAISDRGGWSSTEWALIEVALAVWNGGRSARVADLLAFDDQRLAQVLNVFCRMRPGAALWLAAAREGGS